jgi:DNA-binding LacI/PurR family transcriptional regulator
MTASTKYQTVRSKLESAIRSGELAGGDQLPAEQTLADQYGVSLMTARKVVCDLVTADLLERRARKGTFVRHHAMERVTATTLNLIVMAYDTSFQRTFLNQGMRAVQKRGWRGNIIRLADGQQDAAVRALQDGELALLMIEQLTPQSALGLAARNARGRAVFVGMDFTHLGIPSIFVDVNRSLRIAAEHLRSKGHREIVLIDQRLSDSQVRLHTRAWQFATEGIYDAAEAATHCIHLETPSFSCPSFDAHSLARELLTTRNPRPTAFVTFGEEITQGTLAACRDSGLSVPDDVSILNVLDAPSMYFAAPPVTSLDMNFERQIEFAFEILQSTLDGLPAKPDLHAVEPLLVERQSVALANPPVGSEPH